jgi:tetratricopeptide (TPR) repeat protein
MTTATGPEGATKPDAEMALDLARLAQLFLSYGKHKAADKLLTAALELDAGNAAVNRVRAFTAYKCGRFAEAAELARQTRLSVSASPATDQARNSSEAPGAGTAEGLAAIGLSLVEAFSLMSLGRASDARQQYASLESPEQALTSPADMPRRKVAETQ